MPFSPRYTAAPRGQGAFNLVSLAEAAHCLRVHPASIRRLISRGQLPAFRVGGQIRIAHDAIGAYLSRRRIGKGGAR